MEVNAIRTVTIRAKTEGVSQSAAELNKLATAQTNVATSAESMATVTDMASKRQLSAAEAYKRQAERIDEVARAQARIARETTIADRALQQGIITQTEHAERLGMIQSRYNVASQATQKFAQQSGLARHELINLGRQAQDVGVSLASGQSPFMVLVQQGSQIADVFATSGGTVRGFFEQAAGWAKRFFTSTAGIVTGIAAIGAAAVYAAYQFSSASKTVEQALEEQNRLLKEGTKLLDLRTSAAERAHLQSLKQTQFEVGRNVLDLQVKLNAEMEKTITLAQKRFTTPTQVPGEMGEAPTAFAAQATAGYDRLTAAMERLRAAQAANLPGFKEFNAELGRIGMAHPELAQVVEEFIKLGQTGLQLEFAQQNAKALQAAIAGTATEAQKAALGLSNVNAEADRMLINLREQGELMRAGSEMDRARIEAAQTYNRLIKENVDAQKAGAIAAQMISNARSASDAREMAEADQEAAAASQRRAQANEVAAAQAERELEAYERAKEISDDLWRRGGHIPFFGTPDVPALQQTRTGMFTQFNPQGYTMPTSGAMQMQAIVSGIYGAGGFDPMTGAPNAQGLEFQFNKMLAANAGSIGNTVNQLLGQGIMTAGGLGVPSTVDEQKLQLLARAIDVLPQEQQAAAIRSELGLLQAAPGDLKTAELIRQLSDKLEQLTKATEDNTAVQEKITDVLSPFYASDPRRTFLGFRAFAQGGIMSADGPLPIRRYEQGGIATVPQISIFGEGSTPEAYVPVPSGKIPVEMKGGHGRPIMIANVFNGSVDRSTVGALKQTAFQNAQQVRRITG